jgi:lipid-A-disaccharide synthase
MVVCYRVSRLTELMGRLLLRVPWISLVNIALGRAVVPEIYLRRDATAERVVAEAVRLIETPDARAAQQAAFAELRAELGEPGVGARAARLVLAAAGVASCG